MRRYKVWLSIVVLSCFAAGIINPASADLVYANSTSSNQLSNWKYETRSDGTIGILEYIGEDLDVSVPSKIEGKYVTSIGENAFYAKHLDHVVVPEGVLSIGDYSFAYSTLRSISLPESLLSIGIGAFSYSDVNSISIPSGVKHISTSTFAESVLEEISLPNGLVSIGDAAFFECNLLSVDIPETVKSIGAGAFALCSNLRSITIPDSVLSMGDDPFMGCSRLRRVVVSPNHPYLFTEGDVLFSKPDKRLIWCSPAVVRDVYKVPEGTWVIGDDAFGFCDYLTIEIPNSVTSIGYLAFNNTQTLIVYHNSYAEQYCKENNLSYRYAN